MGHPQPLWGGLQLAITSWSEAASINIKFIGIDGHLDTLYYEDELKFLNYETETSGSIKKIHGGK